MKKRRSFLLLCTMILLAGMVLAGCKKEEEPVNDIEEQVQEEVQEEVQKETQEEVKEEETEEVEEIEEEPVIDWSTAESAWTTTDLNLRVEPNTECEILTVLAKGTELKKSSEENGWAYIKCGDHKGYVSTKYLANEKPAEEQTSTSQKVEVIPGQYRDPNAVVVVIDPGHQRKGDSTKEPNGPGSSVMKARVASGTTGAASGVPEYEMVLQVSKLLKTELQNRGYTVYMTRETHDVNISNMERAQYATTVGADIAVRIHGDGVDNSSVRGATALVPSASNAYVSHLAKASQSLGSNILSAYCSATGFKNRGVAANDTMTGINWSDVPVTIIELGFMSNPTEDMAMLDPNMQNNMAQGIANGIDAYFGF